MTWGEGVWGMGGWVGLASGGGVSPSEYPAGGDFPPFFGAKRQKKFEAPKDILFLTPKLTLPPKVFPPVWEGEAQGADGTPRVLKKKGLWTHGKECQTISEWVSYCMVAPYRALVLADIEAHLFKVTSPPLRLRSPATAGDSYLVL